MKDLRAVVWLLCIVVLIWAITSASQKISIESKVEARALLLDRIQQGASRHRQQFLMENRQQFLMENQQLESNLLEFNKRGWLTPSQASHDEAACLAWLVALVGDDQFWGLPITKVEQSNEHSIVSCNFEFGNTDVLQILVNEKGINAEFLN